MISVLPRRRRGRGEDRKKGTLFVGTYQARDWRGRASSPGKGMGGSNCLLTPKLEIEISQSKEPA